MNKKGVWNLIIRYGILLLLGIPNLFLFYFIFTPLTVYPVSFILSLFDSTSLIVSNNPPTILYNGIFARLVPACIAGAAYYFLLILNLSTPIEIKKRIYSLSYLFGAFLILNILRIIIFVEFFARGYRFFDLAHSITWYFGSTLFILGLWFSSTYFFKIKNIPFYTDLSNIIKDIKKSNR